MQYSIMLELSKFSYNSKNGPGSNGNKPHDYIGLFYFGDDVIKLSFYDNLRYMENLENLLDHWPNV